MSGTYQYDVEIKSNVAKLLSDMKQVQDRLDTVEGKEYKIKLNVDEKKLSNVISNLEKMLDSLGKGTGDFKQFENLSKELSSIVSEVQSLSKAFGKVDDSGTKTLFSSIQNIDKSLSELSQNILNVNKNMNNMGGNTSGAVKQVENITNESKKAASALEDVAKAQAKVNGQKTNISSASTAEQYKQITADTVSVLSDVGKTEDQIISKIQQERKEAEKNNEVLREHLVLLDSAGKVVANHLGSTSNVNGTFSNEQLSQANGGKIIHTHPGKASFFGGKDLQNLFQNSMYDQIKQIELVWGDSSLSIDKSTLTKESSSTILNIMRNVRKTLTEVYGDNEDGMPSQEAREHINAIEKEIFKTISQKLNVSVSENGSMANEVTESLSDIDKAIIKRFQGIKSSVVQDIDASDIIKSQMKDAFPKTSENLEQVAQSEQKVQQEAVATDKALDSISFTPNTEGFDDIIAKFGILREQAEQITKIIKTTKQTADGTPDISYKATLKNGSSYYLGENSTPQVLNASETVYDAKVIAKNAEQEAKAIQAEWDKNLKAIQDYMDAVTKLNNLKAKDKGTGSETNQIALQTQNVEELKQAALEARKNLSSMQAENPDIIAWKQWVDMMKLFDQASKGSAESVVKLKDALDNIKAPSLDKYENKLSSYLNKTGTYDATIARFNDGGWTSDAYLKNVQAVKNAVQEYETLLNKIKTKQNGIVSEEDIQNLKEYESKIKDTIATVNNMSAAEKGYNFVSGQKELDKIHKLLNENSKMSNEAKDKIRAYYTEIESGNPSMSLDRIHGEIMKIYNAEVEAGRAGRTLWDTLKNSGFHQIAAQMAGMVGIYDVINLGKEGFNVVRELNTALTEMRKVSDETVQSLENYQNTTFDTADAIGTTAKQLQNSTADWMRLGESMDQAAESAKDANVLLNVSEFDNIDEATESLVSMSQAYKDLDKMDIINVLNNIGNNYSISTDGLATALKDSASALVTANNDLNEAVSLTTAGNAITQDPSKVGAGLRTISLRLVGKIIMPKYTVMYRKFIPVSNYIG